MARLLLGSLLALSQAQDFCDTCDASVDLLQRKLEKSEDKALSQAIQWPANVPLTSWLPMRIQWLANAGYCGETSFVQSGLVHGQYISQFDVRDMLSQHQSDNKDQLLLGVNDKKAATLLKLNYEYFTPNADTAAFLAWVKRHTAAGHPVVSAFLTNFRDDFFGVAEAELKPGQDEYDHIVTVVDVSGSSTKDYTISFYDHGLWDGGSGTGQDLNPTGKFTYKVKDISKSRTQANLANTPYSLVDSSQYKYAIALTGPAGTDPSVNCPVYIKTTPNEELPIMEEHSDARPPHSDMKLTVTAYGLSSKGSYTVYMYTSLASVPGKGDDPSEAAVDHWDFAGGKSTHVITTSVKSDTFAAFRCYIQ